ncbi:hypothetical protein SA27298_0936 [Streptococcus anginosus]|nr:hypothetical protein SA27298_0936 [Streptococcus anginosus]
MMDTMGELVDKSYGFQCLLLIVLIKKKTNTQKQSCLSLGRKIRLFLKSSII